MDCPGFRQSLSVKEDRIVAAGIVIPLPDLVKGLGRQAGAVGGSLAELNYWRSAFKGCR